MLTAVQLFCLHVSGPINANASFIVAIMCPSVSISSVCTVMYCVLYYLPIKAVEGYTFIYLFRYLFIYFLPCSVSYRTGFCVYYKKTEKGTPKSLRKRP